MRTLGLLAPAVFLAACGSGPAATVREAVPRKPVTPTEALIEYYAFCVQKFRDEGGRWPKAILELYVKPEGMFTWKGPYLDGSPPPIDEWKRYVTYRETESGFELRSAGPDGTPGNGDDVVFKK